MIFLDTNVLIDVIENIQADDAEWSRRTLAHEARGTRLMVNLVVVAELSALLAEPDLISLTFSEAEIEMVDLTFETAIRAGAAFREYRRRGGSRATILPDFLIAAHAATLGARLMTRDRRLASYFPELTLVTPDADGG